MLHDHSLKGFTAGSFPTTFNEFIFYLLAQVLSDFGVHLVVMVIAPYHSITAIKRNNSKDAVKWLTFWVVYGFLRVFEDFFESLLDLFPYYYSCKFLFVIFLMFFKGSELVFKTILDPLVTKIVYATQKKLKEVVGATDYSAGATTTTGTKKNE